GSWPTKIRRTGPRIWWRLKISLLSRFRISPYRERSQFGNRGTYQIYNNRLIGHGLPGHQEKTIMSAPAFNNLVGITGIARRLVLDGALQESAAREALDKATEER